MQDVLELRDPEADGALSSDYMQQRRASFVSYGTFLEEYWPHFPQTLTKGLGGYLAQPKRVMDPDHTACLRSYVGIRRVHGYVHVKILTMCCHLCSTQA